MPEPLVPRYVTRRVLTDQGTALLRREKLKYRLKRVCLGVLMFITLCLLDYFVINHRILVKGEEYYIETVSVSITRILLVIFFTFFFV